MEKTKKLYPLEFSPVEIRHEWGNERIAIADLGIEDSVVREGWLADNSIGDIMDTYMERVVGDAVYSYYGRQLPVLVKFLDIKGELPVHVHADDTVSEQRYDILGGKELWYIMEASPEARIFLGFRKDVSASELYERCSEGSVKEMLDEIRPKKGDFILIEPGTVHSAGNGLEVAVIKESSELPFILDGDEGESAENHLAEAMDFIDYRRNTESKIISGNLQDGNGPVSAVAECPEFHVSKICLKDPLHMVNEEAGSFLIYVCVAGEASIQIPSEENGKKKTVSHQLRKGEAVLVPAEIQDYFIVPADRNTVLLEAGAGQRDDTDNYIDPDTEPFLEGEDYEGLEDEEREQDDEFLKKSTGRHDMKWN